MSRIGFIVEGGQARMGCCDKRIWNERPKYRAFPRIRERVNGRAGKEFRGHGRMWDLKAGLEKRGLAAAEG